MMSCRIGIVLLCTPLCRFSVCLYHSLDHSNDAVVFNLLSYMGARFDMTTRIQDLLENHRHILAERCRFMSFCELYDLKA